MVIEFQTLVSLLEGKEANVFEELIIDMSQCKGETIPSLNSCLDGHKWFLG